MQRKALVAVLVIFLVLLAAVPPRLAAAGPRNLIVFFDFRENVLGVENAVDFIFNKMLEPSDQLIIQSPARVYGFSAKTLAQPKAQLAAAMREKLRSDVSQASQFYKQTLSDLQTAARNIAVFAYPDLASDGGGLPETRDLGELFTFYRQGLDNLAQLRKVSDAALRQLTGAFKGQKGENHVIILFEREFRPVPRREALNALGDMPKFAFQANELFAIGSTADPFDTAALAEYFKQVPLAQHFVYVTSKAASASANQIENSGDLYAAFSKIAQATGGVTITTAEPQDGLKAVLKAWKEAK